MTRPWETDSCETLLAYYSHYYIPQAAALWCNVPPERLQEIFDQATEVSRNIYRHPTVLCLEPRCRAIHDAIDSNELPCGRDGKGRNLESQDHVAPERRTVARTDLKEWIAREFPADKPPFLFDPIERSTHSAISADAYQALKAEHDKLASRLTRLKEDYQKLRQEKEDLERLNESLKVIADRPKQPGERAETTYLNIIGAMLQLMLGESPGGQPHSVFTTQAAIISNLLAYHEGKPGISARTLEQKFADAKRSLSSTT